MFVLLSRKSYCTDLKIPLQYNSFYIRITQAIIYVKILYYLDIGIAIDSLSAVYIKNQGTISVILYTFKTGLDACFRSLEHSYNSHLILRITLKIVKFRFPIT